MLHCNRAALACAIVPRAGPLSGHLEEFAPREHQRTENWPVVASAQSASEPACACVAVATAVAGSPATLGDQQ